jgi:hypothetical protein
MASGGWPRRLTASMTVTSACSHRAPLPEVGGGHSFPRPSHKRTPAATKKRKQAASASHSKATSHYAAGAHHHWMPINTTMAGTTKPTSTRLPLRVQAMTQPVKPPMPVKVPRVAVNPFKNQRGRDGLWLTRWMQAETSSAASSGHSRAEQPIDSGPTGPQPTAPAPE